VTTDTVLGVATPCTAVGPLPLGGEFPVLPPPGVDAVFEPPQAVSRMVSAIAYASVLMIGAPLKMTAAMGLQPVVLYGPINKLLRVFALP
jgi:hypothetical protein